MLDPKNEISQDQLRKKIPDCISKAASQTVNNVLFAEKIAYFPQTNCLVTNLMCMVAYIQ